MSKFESVWMNDMNPWKESIETIINYPVDLTERINDIREYIFKNEGSTGHEIAKHFNMKINVVHSDLKKLVKAKIINYKISLIPNSPYGFCKCYSKTPHLFKVKILKESVKKQILDYVIANGPCTSLEISTALKVKQDTIRNVLANANKTGLIKSSLNKRPSGTYNVHSRV